MKKGINTVVALLIIMGLAGCGTTEEKIPVADLQTTEQQEVVQNQIENTSIEVPELALEKIKEDVLNNVEIQKHKGQDVEIKEVNILDKSVVEVAKFGQNIGMQYDIYTEIKVLAGNMIRTTNYYALYEYIPEESSEWQLKSVTFEGRAKYRPTEAISVTELPDWLDITDNTKLIDTVKDLENNLVVYKFSENEGKTEFIVNCSIDEMNGTWVFEKLYTEDEGETGSGK